MNNPHDILLIDSDAIFPGLSDCLTLIILYARGVHCAAFIKGQTGIDNYE